MIGTDEAEAAVVARLLLDPREIPLVSGLTGDDFAVPAWGKAFDAMLALHADEKPVDLIHLHALGVEIDVLDLPPMATAPIEEYVKLVRAGALRRQVSSLGQEITRAANTGDLDRVIDLAGQARETAESAPHEDTLGLVDLADYRNPPQPLLLGVMSPVGTTVLYGDGGDGKGWVAAKWASQVDGRVAILDFEGHPNEWAYRLERFGLTDVLYASPPGTLDKWAGERAERLLRESGVKFLVVDSAAYASSVDDPYSPAGVMVYKWARARLGNLPTLLLAHTAKGTTGIYGSVFWRNEARLVWHLTRDNQGQRTLLCKKSNNYPDFEGTKLVVEFDARAGILNLHPYGKPWRPVTEETEMPTEPEPDLVY